MTIQEIKQSNGYEFECNMSEEYKTYTSHDELGCAFIWLGNVGAEYNFCIQGDGTNCSAIYKMERTSEDDVMETDFGVFIHYEIDFNNPNWKEDIENAMCSALIDFFEMVYSKRKGGK